MNDLRVLDEPTPTDTDLQAVADVRNQTLMKPTYFILNGSCNNC